MALLRTVFVILFIVQIGFASVPKPLGWVSDYAGILDRTSEVRITEAITAIKVSTGVEIAVVTQNSMGEFGTREEMGLAYLEGWGVGEKGKDNGLLILILYDEGSNLRQYRFESGIGLEGDLPDGLLGQIGREEIVPRFRSGDYGNGALAAVARIGGILGADLSVQVPSQRPAGRKRGIGSIIFFILMFAILGGRRRGSGLLGMLLLGSMMGGRGRIGGSGGGFGGGSFGGFGGGGLGSGGGAGGSW